MPTETDPIAFSPIGRIDYRLKPIVDARQSSNVTIDKPAGSNAT